ncbi:hypothetical protein BGX27_000268, partial [Mortierella sp. AM989]
MASYSPGYNTNVIYSSRSSNSRPATTTATANNTVNNTSIAKPTSAKGSTFSVLSVQVMDPYYRDLQSLQSDHNSLLSKLKQIQQMLQGSYQELAMVQQRSKRAEADSERLRTQMNII